ncbi:MAG TPA: hypothetical protein VLA33_04405 [Gemmatimonadota bacterium]|nr:hypothetical protein [Gemmatimonadota bacterium]
MGIYGHAASSSRWAIALVLSVSLPLAACDVEWGGASFAFVNPAPAPDPAESTTPDDELVEPLPGGDLLYLVRLGGDAADGDATDGAARARPIARMVDGVPVELGVPERVDDAYRTRFDSAFYAPGTELPLHAGGDRIGTLIIGGGADPSPAGCLPVATGRVLLLPGADEPEYAFAWTGEGAFGAPVDYDPTDTDTRMRTFGPVLAENLLSRGGESRPQLAQRVAMRAVPWPGDERPAMAATYLVNDDLGPQPPRNSASSLYFLARFDGRQYVPEWWEVRRYDGADGREAFVYFGAMGGPAGRVDFALRHDGSVPRLAASVDREGEDREIDWVEPAGCPAVSQLGPGPPTPVTGG